MRILVVAATSGELAPLVAKLGSVSPGGEGVNSYKRASHTIDALVTGVGMIATAARCARTLALAPYELALNVGVCGSFDPGVEPGTVVHVVSDRIAELGAEDDDRFLTIQELHLLADDEPPFTAGVLLNPAPPSNPALGRLRPVRGITVNTVHGNARSIAEVVRRFDPQIESMEGAAFMYACLVQKIAFAQVRGVSNMVETRNRQAWKMAEAISRAGETAVSILDHA
jgi:futalosine hydrolase